MTIRKRMETRATDDSSAGGAVIWIEAGLAELAAGGIDAVRIEPLAKRLKVTKGGFYWHFRDRRALLDAMLANWTEGRVAAIEKQTAVAADEIGARLRELLKLYSGRVSAQGMAIELAIRQWARFDATAAAAISTVDAVRLRRVAGLYRKLGLSPRQAEARALLFYSFVFGQSLIALDGDAADRAKLVASCSDLLFPA